MRGWASAPGAPGDADRLAQSREADEHLEVTIGRQTRLYHAFITTAPAVLDAPSTVTLCVGRPKNPVLSQSAVLQ